MYRRFLTAGAAAMLATALLLSGCSKKTQTDTAKQRSVRLNKKKQPKRKQKVRLQKRTKVHQKKTGKHRLTRRVPDRKKRQSRAPEAAKQ